MMAGHKRYVIRYCFNGKHRSFAQADAVMTSADAWYYASLHAGAGPLYGIAAMGNSARAVRQFAEQYGVTDVGFCVAAQA